jgi:hypothetical protein
MREESSVQIVRDFLRGQNLEQLGRIDEAIDVYEGALEAGFDSTGPYDRLIEIYANRAAHVDVVRVAEAALLQVKTTEDKRRWYADMRAAAATAQAKVPTAHPKN